MRMATDWKGHCLSVKMHLNVKSVIRFLHPTFCNVCVCVCVCVLCSLTFHFSVFVCCVLLL